MENITDKNYRDIENLALLMDDRFELFGFRFGVNFIIDLIPVAGDVITTLIALYIFGLARKYNLSKWKMFRMAFNIAIYFLIGLIPWLGDFFGAWWKPNKRNVKLLQSYIKNTN